MVKQVRGELQRWGIHRRLLAQAARESPMLSCRSCGRPPGPLRRRLQSRRSLSMTVWLGDRVGPLRAT